MINKKIIILFYILLFAFFGLSLKIDKPFVGIHDWNGAYFGLTSRHFTPLSSWGTSHYTPFLEAYFWIVSRIFGIKEIVLRFSVVFLSLLSLIYLYRIIAMIFSSKTALIAIFFVVLTPMFLYYGKLPDHDPVVLCFVIISVFYFLQNVFRPSQKAAMMKFLLFYIFSLLESWPSFFISPFFLIAIFLNRKKIKVKKLALLVISPPLAVISLFLLFQISISGSLNHLINIFKFRTSFSEGAAGLFSKKEYFILMARRNAIYYTLTLLLLSFFGFLSIFFQKKSIEKNKIFWANLILFGGYAFSFSLVFPNLYWIHDYKNIHFLPLVAVLSAHSVFLLIKAFSQKTTGKIFLYLFLVLVSLSIFFERHKYYLAILNSENSKEAFFLGKRIKKMTGGGKSVLILPKEYVAIYKPFLEYYSESKIFDEYGDRDLKTQKYELIILTSSAVNHKNIKIFSKEKYTIAGSGEKYLIFIKK